MISALITVLPRDRLAGEPFACVGVDVHAPRGAPAGEPVRVDIDPLDDDPASFEALLDGFRLLQPLLVGRRQLVAVGEELAQGGPVIRPVPREADSAKGDFGHSDSPSEDGGS